MKTTIISCKYTIISCSTHCNWQVIQNPAQDSWSFLLLALKALPWSDPNVTDYLILLSLNWLVSKPVATFYQPNPKNQSVHQSVKASYDSIYHIHHGSSASGSSAVKLLIPLSFQSVHLHVNTILILDLILEGLYWLPWQLFMPADKHTGLVLLHLKLPDQ